MKPHRQLARLASPAMVAVLLTGCLSTQPFALPKPLVHPKSSGGDNGLPPAMAEEAPPVEPYARELVVEATPKPPAAGKMRAGEIPPPRTAKAAKAADITLNFDQEKLPTLIQLIYGTILKKDYALDPAVASRTDRVTLRTGPQTPAQIEQIAKILLKSYGVAVIEVGGGFYRVVPDKDAQGYAPEVRRGPASSDMPLPLRPIFQLVELKAVQYTDVASWLVNMFGKKVTVTGDSPRNAIMLSGQADDVAAAVEAVQVLDQPAMKGRQSARIDPVFMSAEELAKRLSEVMTAEGYNAGTLTGGSFAVVFVPITSINAVITFAADPTILSHALDWAKSLDRASSKPSDSNYFIYQAQNTDANRLADTVRRSLATNTSSASAQPSPSPTGAPGGAGGSAAPAQSNALPGGMQVVVDAPTNSLIFKGTGQDYAQLLGLAQALDRPAKAALIEVTVAEVDLGETLKLGVEMTSQMLHEGAFQYLTGGAGLTVKYLTGVDSATNAIQALATQNRAKVLSSPRLLARNGETATIQVGQQVPIITSSQTNQATGGVGVIQSVQYKDVGVILKVKPVIYSGDRIELEVAQEVSDATATTTGVTTSPTINTKKVETRLALKNGSTVMLGGLISNAQNNTETGVPWLKDIPWLGQLFRQNSDDSKRQELIILITPYTVLDDHDAQSITDSFRRQIGPWATAGSDKPTQMK